MTDDQEPVERPQRESFVSRWQTDRQSDESETRIRYRQDGGKYCIDVRLHNWRQLFDSRDPSPFRDRDLDDDAVAYIVNSFLEIGHPDECKLVLHLSEARGASIPEEAFADSIRAFFSNERRMRRGKLRQMFRRARMALVIGASFLTICMSCAHWIVVHDVGAFSDLAREGLVIIGWVAVWRPIDMLLYEWWPHIDLLSMYSKLSHLPIEVRYNV